MLKVIKDLSGTWLYQVYDTIYGLDGSIYIPTERPTLVGLGGAIDSIVSMVQSYDDYFKIYILPEEPNGFFGNWNNTSKMEKVFDLILGMCPYCDEWRQKYYGSNKRITSFIPVAKTLENCYPSECNDKVYDVYHCGHTPSHPPIVDIWNIVSKFKNHKIVNGRVNPLSESEKMKLNGKSKISVTYAYCYLESRFANYIHTLPNWNENIAFQHMETNIVPQIKCRTFEAAFSKSLILHQRDSWNVIEKWFEPNSEFIYFDTTEDLEEKIREILNNYEKYFYIAENAYNRAINNYTGVHFIEKYILPYTK